MEPTRQGAMIERCPKCGGVWLDDGELMLFARRPREVEAKLAEALELARPSARLSPASGAPMSTMPYPGGPEIDRCPDSGGLWLDKAEFDALLETEKDVRITLEPALASAEAVPLAPLPNLLLRSAATLIGLYVILGVVLIAAVEFLGLPLGGALGIGLALALAQFLIGPFVMDLMLRFIYRMDWVELAALPPHLNAFVTRIAQANRIRPPRFGVIDDGAPQAFTYGHRPNNARIVISRGILELLEPEEAEAVVAHEIGHAVHWDMVLMTVAQVVPLMLYYVYRTLMRMQRRRSSKGGGGTALIALGAYVLYIVAQYVVLWFSRTREYHADRFAGEATGDPGALAGALVKIAYGLSARDEGAEPEGKEGGRRAELKLVGSMGIFDQRAAKALAITSYGAGHDSAGAELDREAIKGAMRWDMWNPWARWYELHSTHPLVAKRLLHLSAQARSLGKAPFIAFDERRPESYWDEFAVDFLVYLLPILWGIAALGALWLSFAEVAWRGLPIVTAVALLGCGGMLVVRTGFVYRGGYFPSLSVSALLKKVKVSRVRPVPCQVKGKVIGRGVPGYIASEDFVMRDRTGIMFLDYRQPLAIWEFFFGLLRAGRYEGKEVQITGWYRRSPVPFVEVKTLECEGELRRCWVSALHQATAFAVVALGLYWLVGALAAPGLLP